MKIFKIGSQFDEHYLIIYLMKNNLIFNYEKIEFIYFEKFDNFLKTSSKSKVKSKGKKTTLPFDSNAPYSIKN